MSKFISNRENLVKVTNLVSPALGNAYIAAFTHIKFDGSMATAYNDITAIAAPCEIGIKRCIPGDLLARGLASYGSADIVLEEGENGTVTMSSGRGSKIKLPTLPNADFPFKWPNEEGNEIKITAEILRGIERCLISVGNDPTHAAQMGITLDSEDGLAVLFSTDNFTISRFQTESKIKLPGDVPVIMPRFFCEQLVRLAKAYPDHKGLLLLQNGSLEVDFGEGGPRLFSKIPVDLEPLDFVTLFKKHVKLAGLKKELINIPNDFDGALGRALLVLSNEMDKATAVTIDEDRLRLHSESALGDADDSMTFDGDLPKMDFHMDPALVQRGTKVATLIGFSSKVTILADSDAQFVHVIAHCSKG